MPNFMKYALIVLLSIVLILTAIDIVTPSYGFFAKVDAGHVGIITHFGKIEDRVLPAGFHLTGYFEHVHPINVRTQIRSGEIVAFSSDIQQVDLFVSVNYNVTPDAANTLYNTVGEGYFETLVSPRVNEDVKAVVSNYTAESLISNREKLSGEILSLLQNDLSQYGITVSTISVENIDFTDAFEAAVEAKQVATQEKQKAQTQQDQKTMEVQKEAERKKLQADAEAYEITTKAEAQAEANKLISQTITSNLIDYIEAQNWNGELPDTFVGGKDAMPIINVENTKEDK